MRRFTIPMLIALCLACGGLPFSDDPDVSFAVPERIPVKKGARVTVLAERLGVSADDLREWNGLTANRVPADTTLVVWRPAGSPPFEPLDTAAPPPEAVAAAPRPRRRVHREGEPDIEETEAHFALLAALNDDALDEGHVADGLVATESVTVDGHVPGTGLSKRTGALSQSLGRIESGPAIGPMSRTRDPDQPPGVHIPSGPVSTPKARKPGAKRCLAANADVALAEDGMAEARGLTIEQVQLGMMVAARKSLGCFPKGTRGEFVVTTDVVAGCDGRVSSLRISDPGPVPGAVSACLTTVLTAAGFPAHARPDGVSFTYPLRYRF